MRASIWLLGLLCVCACGPSEHGSSATGSSGVDPGTGTSGADTTTGDPPVPGNLCARRPMSGGCPAAFEQYYFDGTRCQSFDYDGCGTSIFPDLATCIESCEPCVAFQTAENVEGIDPPMVLRIRNSFDVPLFVEDFRPPGVCALHVPGRIRIVEIESERELDATQGNPHRLCSEAALACEGTCGPDQATLGLLKLDPGGLYVVPWDGVYIDDVTPPADCFADCGEDFTCGRKLTHGGYLYAEARAHVSLASDCGGQPCDCTANADGWCEIPGGALVGGRELRASVSVGSGHVTELEYPK